jgi:Dolichyl-phosphate-mannose-protein mannosyltransferase
MIGFAVGIVKLGARQGRNHPHVQSRAGFDKLANVRRILLELMFPWKLTHRQRSAIAASFLFILAVGVRLLSWQDNHVEFPKVEWGVTEEYREGARLMLQGETSTYLRSLTFMGHPPGYSVLMALLFRFFGDSNTVLQMFQIASDAFSVVIVFLIVSALLSFSPGIFAALLVALSPQLAYYPSLLLPDSISVLPVLLTVYCLALAYRRPRIITFLLAGAFVGVSCWLRANALILIPFLAATIPILFQSGKRAVYASMLVVGVVLVIAPITIKNLVVFHRFIPLSLGAGQKLLQGIAEYDHEGRFGVPNSDVGIIMQEAKMLNRPDYELAGLFSIDGIERDRMRLAQGWSVIRAHPFWYLGVMARRASKFPHLVSVPIVSARPGNSHPFNLGEQGKPEWSLSPDLLLSGSTVSPQSRVQLADDGQSLLVIGDASRTGEQIRMTPITVQQNTDYVIRVPINMHKGRLWATVVNQQGQTLHLSTVYEPAPFPPPEPLQMFNLPFASGNSSYVRLALSNADATANAEVGTIVVRELGPTSFMWTRYPRLLIHLLQKPFIDIWLAPFILAGIALLVRARQWQALTILLIVPVYYLCVQSALHTEWRYVIAIHYFSFALAGVSLSSLIEKLRTVPGLILHKSQT